MEAAWQKDLAEYAPQLHSVVAYADNRTEAFAVDADVYITNTDAVKWLAKQRPSFFARFDSLIVDESSAFKHRTSQRSKALLKIVQYFAYRVLLSATPNSLSITDLWHQVLLLDDGVRLGRNFFQFRNAVCEPKQVGPKASHIKWVDKAGAETAIAGILSDISVRHRFDDCMDIPPNHTYSVQFKMNKQHRALYEQMLADARIQLQDGTVTAVTASALSTKLLQVASGAVYGDSEGYQLIDTDRYELILDLIEQRQHSVCFFNWSHQKQELMRGAEKRGISYAVIDGNTPIASRAPLVAAYQAGYYQTIFLHPQTGAHGLTLTRGTATIWASPIYAADFMKQGLHRIYRGGQTLPTETILIEAEDSVEQRVYALLNSKGASMASFLEIIEG